MNPLPRHGAMVAAVVHLLLFGGALLVPSLTPGKLSAAPQETPEKARHQAWQQLDVMMFRLKMFHHEAMSSMLSSLELPLFRDYFALPESRVLKRDEKGEVVFSEAQRLLRREMEEWVLHLHQRFTIGESCLVDRTGREHFRVVGGEAEESSHFSAEESDSPFFRRAMSAAPGEVVVSKPYMSPDSFHWVLAFSSPVVMADGDIPGFFHFEVPLDVFQTLLRTRLYGYVRREGGPDFDVEEEGRYFLLDRKGLVIADSRRQISTELVASRHPERSPELPDYVRPERMREYFPQANSLYADPAFLAEATRMKAGESGEAQLTLGGRDYVLVYQPVPGLPWTLGHLDPIGGPGEWGGP
ncbi:MAG: cache domain-containing protein [Magnetococcales bacterium]|nr:cache domain-containing protein [Magnetococcales bacterium]